MTVEDYDLLVTHMIMEAEEREDDARAARAHHR